MSSSTSSNGCFIQGCTRQTNLLCRADQSQVGIPVPICMQHAAQYNLVTYETGKSPDEAVMRCPDMGTEERIYKIARKVVSKQAIAIFSFICEDGLSSSYAVPVASLMRPLDEIKAQFKLSPHKWDWYNKKTMLVDGNQDSDSSISLEQALAQSKGAITFEDEFEPSAEQAIVYVIAIIGWC